MADNKSSEESQKPVKGENVQQYIESMTKHIDSIASAPGEAWKMNAPGIVHSTPGSVTILEQPSDEDSEIDFKTNNTINDTQYAIGPKPDGDKPKVFRDPEISGKRTGDEGVGFELVSRGTKENLKPLSPSLLDIPRGVGARQKTSKFLVPNVQAGEKEKMSQLPKVPTLSLKPVMNQFSNRALNFGEGSFSPMTTESRSGMFSNFNNNNPNANREIDAGRIHNDFVFLKQEVDELRNSRVHEVRNANLFNRDTSAKIERLSKQIQQYQDSNVSKELQSRFDYWESEQFRNTKQMKDQLDMLTNRLSDLLEANSKCGNPEVFEDPVISKRKLSEKELGDHPGMDHFDSSFLVDDVYVNPGSNDQFGFRNQNFEKENEFRVHSDENDFVNPQNVVNSRANRSFSRSDNRKNRENESAQSSSSQFLKSLPKMDKYNGTTNWDDYFNQFQRYSTLSNWNEQAKLSALHLCLGGAALHYYESLNSSIKADFDSLIAAMARRFGPETPPEAQRAKFQNLSRNEKESLRSFADRVRETAIQAYPNLKNKPYYNETFLVDAFLKGVNHPEAAIHTMNQNHNSLDAALRGVQMFIEHHKVIYGQKKAYSTKKVSYKNSDQIIPLLDDEDDFDEPFVINSGKFRPPTPVKGQSHKGNDPGHGQMTNEQKMGIKPQNAVTSNVECLTKAVNQLSTLMEKMQISIEAFGQQSMKLHQSNNTFRKDANAKRSPINSPKGSPRRPFVCFNCKQEGHFQRDCPVAMETSLNSNGTV